MNGTVFVALCALLLPSILRAAATQDAVVVRPEETDEILANPGMGWETFGTSAKQDKSLPGWIPSTLYYTRWGWADLEPQAGKLNTALLDGALQAAHDSDQKLAFRVMCCSTDPGQPYHPAWLRRVGGRELPARYDRDAAVLIPDFDDPTVLGRHLDFIRRLGRQYDGHPDLDHVDLGSIGWWGEWHLTGNGRSLLPSLENRMKVVRAYFDAFKKTPLLMLLNGGDCLTYATQHGAGWRADCLGDLGGFSRSWCHMRQGYPSWLEQANCLDAWKTAPVAWESCWDMRKWVEKGWPLRYIFNYALALHASYLNNKSAPLPDGREVRPETERFLRRLGYRFVLKELRYPATAQAGGRFEVASKWQNVGSAPCYHPYRLAYRLGNDSGYVKVIVSKTTVNRWLPGTVPVFTPEFFRDPPDLPRGEVAAATDTLTLPADLPAGQYTVSLAAVDQNEKPVVRLAINGRAADGWYPLGKVAVERER